MLLSNGSVKLRSLGLSSVIFALSTALTGCFFVDGGHSHGGDGTGDTGNQGGDTPPTTGGTDTTPTDTPAITAVMIQPDQVLDANGGEGVGIFVEVTAAGQWHIWTTCDTFTSKQVCSFDIFASTPKIEQLQSYAADQLEGPDTVKDLQDGTKEIVIDTDSDKDGVLIYMDPGAPLVLEAYLDGKSAEGFVYWVSDDVIHTGAPDNPVQFNPAAAKSSP